MNREKHTVLTWVKSIAFACVYPLAFIIVQTLILMAIMLPSTMMDVMNGAEVTTGDLMSKMGSNMGWVTIITAVVMVAAIAFTIRGRRENLLDELRIRAPKMRQILLALFMGVVLNITMVCLLALVPIPETTIGEYDQMMDMMMYGGGGVMAFISLAIAAPISEEVVFRGWAMNRLRRGMPFVAAVIIQSVIFAVAHGNPLQISYVLPLALVFGLLYGWSDNLWVTIAAHVSFNGFSVGLSYLVTGISNDAVGIIGSADGPTAILVGEASNLPYIIISVIGIAIITGCMIAFKRAANKSEVLHESQTEAY